MYGNVVLNNKSVGSPVTYIILLLGIINSCILKQPS